MAILAFQKPDNLIMLEGKDAFTAHFELKPLERGYSDTIGNALRRILLSSIEGYAIASIRIGGVDHEFATIPGVIEDVTNIILNLKKVRLKPIVEGVSEEEVTIAIIGRDVFRAGDLNDVLQSFEVVNKDLVICNMSKDASPKGKSTPVVEKDPSLTLKIRINKGRGYVPAEENAREGDDTNTIPIDSIYTPIRKVMYRHEDFRVQQRTDYEKLIIGITTDGTIDPQKAMQEAASILISHFSLFTDERKLEKQQVYEDEEALVGNARAKETEMMLDTPIENCDLSVRAKNCLISNEVKTIRTLVTTPKQDIEKFRNFGKKTMEELSSFLASMGLSFEMDLSSL